MLEHARDAGEGRTLLNDNPGAAPTVLHVVIGHGLPIYFMNSVRSLRATTRTDAMLVIDNGSQDTSLKKDLAAFVAEQDNVELMYLADTHPSVNTKVGSLYSAMRAAFAYAVEHGFDLVHVVQGDMQTLFWDADVVEKALELFAGYPRCVNVYTVVMSRDKMLTDELADSGTQGIYRLRQYGLTDTGIYHLGRWAAYQMSFIESETAHASKYLWAGFEVVCHPWPVDAPIPWPAVVRRGTQRGREVRTTRPYLLRPLPPEDVARLKVSSRPIWLEDVCVPWGWVCLTPMWTTGLDSIDYWVLRWRDARQNGWARALPRVERRGADPHRFRFMRGTPFRPPLLRLLVSAPLRGLSTRLRQYRG